MRTVRRRLAAVTLLALAACGSGDDGPSEEVGGATTVPAAAAGPPTTLADGPGADPGATWSTAVVPITTDSDSETQLATHGDAVLVVDAAADGTVLSHLSTAANPFVAGTPLATGAESIDLRGVAWDGERWVLLARSGFFEGEDGAPPVPRSHLLTSTDGLAWTDGEATGLDPDGLVLDLIATDDALVAVGPITTDVEAGTFRNVAWRSDDGGRSWQETQLDGGGVAARLVAGDDGLVALGANEEAGGVWTSADGGSGWARLDPEGLPAGGRLHHVVVFGGAELVGSGSIGGEDGTGATAFVVRSADGGRTWTEAGEGPPSESDEGDGHQLFVAGGQLVAVVDPFDDPFADPERCYADIDLCRQAGGNTAHVSLDGDAWAPVDLSGVGGAEVYEVRATDTELVALTTAGEDEIGIARWPLAALLPTTADPPPPPAADVEVLADDEVPEPGVRYASPLWLHCGMDWLSVGGQAWLRTDDGPDLTQGDIPPEGWPVARGQLFGFVTLVAEDRIEYSIGDGEVVATYGPPTREVELCA